MTWRTADGRRDDIRLSSLAVTSIRALITAAITSILARTGGRRWCEFATAQPSTAEAFLQIYPQARFLCLHRAHTDVIYEALQASPWGLEGLEFAPFTNLYPERTAAALTAYWAARSELLIKFEEDHPDSCRRVRYEDLASSLNAPGLLAFINLEETDHDITGHEVTGDISQTHPGSSGRPQFPADQVPAPLLAKVQDLASKLGYPPLVPDEQSRDPGLPVTGARTLW